MLASAKSLYPFFPDATYVAVCNGDRAAFDRMQSMLTAPFTKAFSSLDYEWPFVFDSSGKRCFWKKWWPAYLPQLGGTQFHIDNDILFRAKPSRFLGDFDVYCLTEDIDFDRGRLGYNKVLFLTAGCLAELCKRDLDWVPTNTGVVGVTEEASHTFWPALYHTANNLYTQGLDMFQTAEQACVGQVAQLQNRYDVIQLRMEDRHYIATAYFLLYQDEHNIPSDMFVGLHFIDRAKRIMKQFVKDQGLTDWTASKIGILKKYLDDPVKYGILWEMNYQDRWKADLDSLRTPPIKEGGSFYQKL